MAITLEGSQIIIAMVMFPTAFVFYIEVAEISVMRRSIARTAPFCTWNGHLSLGIFCTRVAAPIVQSLDVLEVLCF